MEAVEPTKPGWYAYSGGNQYIVFHLRDSTFTGKQWSAHFDNGDSGDCAWGYIEQCLDVWDLVPLVPLTNPPPPFGVAPNPYHQVTLFDLDGIDE
jgi:hypothetical protein